MGAADEGNQPENFYRVRGLRGDHCSPQIIEPLKDTKAGRHILGTQCPGVVSTTNSNVN